MVECSSQDDVGSGRDFCVAREVPIAIDLGRQINDPVVSFHVTNPSNFAIEYGWGCRLVDDSTWQVEHYSSADASGGTRS
jgi:3,4-dihydroxy-9,10-secoandrosta-1,3,5(10)-triene-9,17-dione 4,5-dioxygenase